MRPDLPASDGPHDDVRARLRLADILVACVGVLAAARLLLEGYWTYAAAVLAIALLFATLIQPWNKGARRGEAARSGLGRGEVRDEIWAFIVCALASFGLFGIARLAEFGPGVVFDQAGHETIRRYTILIVFLPLCLLTAWGESRRRRERGGGRG